MLNYVWLYVILCKGWFIITLEKVVFTDFVLNVKRLRHMLCRFHFLPLAERPIRLSSDGWSNFYCKIGFSLIFQRPPFAGPTCETKLCSTNYARWSCMVLRARPVTLLRESKVVLQSVAIVLSISFRVSIWRCCRWSLTPSSMSSLMLILRAAFAVLLIVVFIPIFVTANLQLFFWRTKCFSEKIINFFRLILPVKDNLS